MKYILFSKVLTHIVASMPQAGASFDFKAIAITMAGISFGMIGVIMAASGWMPDLVEPFKRHIPTVITGLVLVGISSVIITAFGG